jgi:hypothetical protein
MKQVESAVVGIIFYCFVADQSRSTSLDQSLLRYTTLVVSRIVFYCFVANQSYSRSQGPIVVEVHGSFIQGHGAGKLAQAHRKVDTGARNLPIARAIDATGEPSTLAILRARN